MSKLIVVSENIYPESKIKLCKMGFTLLDFKSQCSIEKSVSAHPDMFITQLGDKLIYDNAINKLFTNLRGKENIIESDMGQDSEKILEYPHNIGFNCVKVGDKLICNKKYTCSRVIKYAGENGIEILDVKQGYAKCSTCVISDNAIITEDESIAECAEKNGIDVLRIQKGHVKLDGYDYGFIGGCSGLIENKLVAFNGNVFLHPDCKRILDFCYNHSVGIVNLCDKELYDVGSIIRIY